jgi:hypothetical protein
VGQRSKVKQLPREIREWLDHTLAEKNFAGYEQLAGELEQRGYAISKSSIHRYGANLERKIAAVKASTEAAKLIAAGAPDDADQRSAAVISLIQTEVFDVLVALQDLADADPMKRAKLLSTVAKNIATLSRASVNQKKHELEIRSKVAAAQKTITAAAKRTGASPELIKIVEEQLGILR